MKKLEYIIVYLTVCIIATVFFCGCSKYNYPNIFPFDHSFYERAKKISGINGYEAFMSNAEFEGMKATLRRHGFVDWKELGDLSFYSQDIAVNRNFLGVPHGGMFSKRAWGSGGEFPVIIYFSDDIGKVVILIADGMM